MREGRGCFSPLTRQVHGSCLDKDKDKYSEKGYSCLGGLAWYHPNGKAPIHLLHGKETPLSQLEVYPMLYGSPTSQRWKWILPECPHSDHVGQNPDNHGAATEGLG